MATAELRVGLLGLGTVNTAVARLIESERDRFESSQGRRPVIVGAAVRDVTKLRDVDLGPDALVSDDAEALVSATRVEVVIEAMGGVEPARALIAAALTAGKHVITANKEVMARHGADLGALAVKHGVSLRHSASVGASTPALELLDNALLGEPVDSITAICNTTTNIILSAMARGVDFATALADAQRDGIAEADPTLDIDGHDAAAKLVLLAMHAWHGQVPLTAVRRDGIRNLDARDVAIAAGIDHSVKLIAHARMWGDRVALSVQPTLVAKGHPLAAADGNASAYVITSAYAESTVLRGRGGGGTPTASAMLSDLAATARDGAAGWHPLDSDMLALADAESPETAAYLRIATQATSSADAAEDEIVLMLEDRGVRVTGTVRPDPQQLVVLTGIAPVAVIERALETIETLPAVARLISHLDLIGAD